jgi:hypothetical protein
MLLIFLYIRPPKRLGQFLFRPCPSPASTGIILFNPTAVLFNVLDL